MNSIETCILPYMKEMTSQSLMHETALKASALGLPRGLGWGGRWAGGLEWGTHVHPWLIHVNAWEYHHNIVKQLASN